MAAAGAAARGRAAGARRPPPPRAAPLPRVLALLAAAAAAGPGPGGAARLYRAGEDAVWVLDSGSVRGATANSSAAWLVQFYSSWCGHCIGYAPTWRALAADVRDWATAIRVAALDCAEEKNQDVCRAYDVHFYPTFRYFKAFTKDFTTGENFKGHDRELQTVRQTMIDFLQNHTEGTRPPACPPLDPVQPSDVPSLLDSHSGRYVAIIFESNGSYVGREVTLDLIPYENIVVTRALDGDRAFLQSLGVASVPSCYLIYPNGSRGLISVAKPLRSFFSSYLKSLPGVRKKSLSLPKKPSPEEQSEVVAWREFDRAKLYMADLESGLHYLLRVELAAHRSLAGAELKTLRDFVTLVAKLFPGRAPVRKLLETLQEWLSTLPLDRIPYNAVLDLVNNKMRISGIFLTNHVTWVGCQGSRPELRGYPCSLWKLFHTLTVEASAHPEALLGTGLEEDPAAVLQTLRRYIRTFFGCRECGEHFEAMAKESMDTVKTPDQALLWLWRKHNAVNSRLAGHLSEDPKFPKVPWPTPELCPACHEEIKGLDSWNEGQVLLFLKRHYGRENLVDTYSADLGGAGAGAPTGRGPGPLGKPQGDQDDPSLHPHHVLEPRTERLENLHHRLDLRLQSPQGPRAQEEAPASVPFLGVGFSSLDMSLCVVLYVASSLFLMLMYFFFRVRSKRWKVRLYHPAV
ncbi:sulfhydryl oxidase 2 [Perognathus longimembris pacificus]|uniref:sulfhydryl oxidase 2 n=1 Tax=Perognathus longimembris pacificus TaxID=214514 RepID=UPI00201A124C|nr:sulfhydryl oxidase 2 [Perognathus longimembris pacificus]XP_048201958.1 sulfhydryl oxidase 2 [Perognathus longimembris pacificus]